MIKGKRQVNGVWVKSGVSGLRWS